MTSTVDASDRAKKLADEMAKRSGLSRRGVRAPGRAHPAARQRGAGLDRAAGRDRRAPTASRCCRTTTPARSSAAGSARSAAACPNSRPRSRPRRRPRARATTSCSARPTWCAAAATPAGPRPPTWWSAGSARSWRRTTTIRRSCSPPSVSPRTAWRRWRGPGGWSREAPAAAAGLGDRGRIVVGCRADVILVDAGQHPRVVATIVAGRVVYLAEADRLANG